jgi:hypothetical protein
MAMLTGEMLDAYVAALRAQGAPVVSHLRPGLSDGAIDEILAPVGLSFPEEARIWFRYRDGVDRSVPTAHLRLAHLFWWAPLAECCAEYTRIRTIVREFESDDLGSAWPPFCFPFVVGGSTMAIDIAGTSTAPVHVLDLHDWENELRAPAYSTLGELVEAWTLALNAGGLGWDADKQWFFADDRRLDQIGVPTEVV